LQINEAFLGYESVRHRLPAVSKSGQCLYLSNLEDLIDEIDVFLLDAFGVLNIGNTAIEGVPERVSKLQNIGKKVIVVSNAGGFPHALLMKKYANLGYSFDTEDVITSRKALLKGLLELPTQKYGLMATESLGRADLENIDIKYLSENIADYDNSDAFLLLGSAVWTEERQEMLLDSLKRNSRPVYVGNPDIVAPREGGFSVEPGSFAHRVADITGISPIFYGKPFRNIFDLAFERLGNFNPDRTVMVGDSLHTDILGGHNVGIKTALISGHGFFSGQGVDKPIETSGIKPDYILADP
jgi:HAD superfamily hydrolase (TIGR01450 family)